LAVGIGAAALGGLIAIGPQYMFKICEQTMHGGAHGATNCFWVGQAEIGVGALIAALGIAYLFFSNPLIRAGLSVGILFGAILSLAVADILLKFCEDASMSCHLATLPALNIVGTLAVILGVSNTAYLFGKPRHTGSEAPSNA
jgi:hypothetical protein